MKPGCVQFALSPLPNYPSSRWPRKWADILFMRRKIHLQNRAEILSLDNCPSFKFHLIWIFQNLVPLCTTSPACPAVELDECLWSPNVAERPAQNFLGKSPHTIDKSVNHGWGRGAPNRASFHLDTGKGYIMPINNAGWLLKQCATWIW